ncbi:MAG: hypothetical protein DCC57_09035, partial [Chloroflexi bacterium]
MQAAGVKLLEQESSGVVADEQKAGRWGELGSHMRGMDSIVRMDKQKGDERQAQPGFVAGSEAE